MGTFLSTGYCYSYPDTDGYEDSLNNGCYTDLPYLHSDEYCYSYPDTGSYNYGNPGFGYDTHSIQRDVNGITWNVYDSKGNLYSWSFDSVGYENLIINGHDLSVQNTEDPLPLADSYGNEFTTTNLDHFVYGAFEDTIEDVYNNSDSNSDFIWEVWNIASQLTEYTPDRDDGYYVGDEGRYALDTLYRGGGDCEDLAILIADMLVSAKHTENWTIHYVYMDIDNPTDSNTVNHVILHVNDGTSDYFIEATNTPSWDYYPEGVTGWSFDVI